MTTPQARMVLQGTMDRLRRDNQRLRAKNTAMRKALLHDCAVCRVARCSERDRLMHEAFGREWLLLRTPDSE